MPERINATHQQPSPHITWIKPLLGADSARAQDFLERIAAISHPIMKAHHLRITTLEEHEPNREFIGRNFNAGEIIQLVLKSPRDGRWLSFRTVQMVMMHELAHCLQMNHGREFWKVNGGFKGELRALWEKGYTGEGIWGRGRTLLSGEYDRRSGVGDEGLPDQLCGGAYRSRRPRRRRRAGAGAENGETYAEKKQRRIEKKFGMNGVALGDDQETRVKLEYGQKIKGNPRVANSGRGRELRAAAALARFGQQKKEEAKEEEAKAKAEEGMGSEQETEDEYEECDEGANALNPDGSEVRDEHGHGMIRVCGDEDSHDENVKQEMDELQQLNGFASGSATGSESADISPTRRSSRNDKGTLHSPTTPPSRTPPMSTSQVHAEPLDEHGPTLTANISSEVVCPICSMANDPASLLCAACSHVLDIKKVTRYWKCPAEACRGSQYINSADAGLCGVCGSRKPSNGDR